MARIDEGNGTQTQPISATGAARSMAGAAALVMVFFVLSRATGLLREMVIGAQFGTSAELDAYLAAFRVPDLLFQLVAGGALGSAFIPTFTASWSKGEERAAWLLFSRILNLMSLLLLLLAGSAALLAPVLVERVIAPGFSPQQQALTVDLMRWMLVSTIVFGASGLVMGALNAVQHFTLPAAAPVLYNLAIIAGAWLLAPRFGVHGLVIGVVAGAFAHLLVQLPALLRRGAVWRPSLGWRDRDVHEVARLMGPRVLGLFFVQLNFLVNTILASNLPAGSLSALNYAWLLMLLPQGIFAQAIATVAFPTFATQIATGKQAEMGRSLARILSTVLFLTLPATATLLVLRLPLVQLLFQRGSFSLESSQSVAFALQFYALGLVAHSVVEIVVRAFYALHDTLTPVVIGVGAMTLNILFSLLWIGWLGYGGLALANSAATAVEMVVLVWLLGRRLGRVDLQALLPGLLRSGLAAVGMAGALWLWLGWLSGRSALTDLLPAGWVAALGGLLLAGLVYLFLGFLLGNQELRSFAALLSRPRLTRSK
ncbi:MAG: murein biosynthesis integral membrane protein MurJ [Caldilineaceae bacterium]|nr:murein biosynthesis integral membrane protein MurJ [Caldilineaceae bacterium]